MSATPQMIEFEEAFIRDEIAKQKEPYQRPYDFLYTGRAPAVGQRTETHLSSTNGGWCLLSGIVTEVGELPTFDMWITTSAMAPPLHVCEGSPDPYANVTSDVIMGFHEDCPFPDCTMCLVRNGDKEMSLGTMMERTLQQFGTLQNQTMTAYAYLNFDWFHKEDKLPVKSAHVYKVVYKCNDNQINTWCVTSIQDVTDLPPGELPRVFKDWEIGRKSANVAPFDLSDVDRKVWYVQNEVQWTRNLEEDARRVARLAEEHADAKDFYPEEHARYSGPHPGKSALFLFARASCPAIMTTPADGYADVPELKDLLRQSITKFETLAATKRQVWDEKAAEDMQQYIQEKEESGDY